MKQTRAFLVVTLILAANPNSVDTGRAGLGAARMSIVASPAYSFEPGFVNLLIRHTPRDGDRNLVVEIESADLFHSSVIPLEGPDAPSVHATQFRSLTKGRYMARVWLERNDNASMRAETSFHVAGINETPLPR